MNDSKWFVILLLGVISILALNDLRKDYFNMIKEENADIKEVISLLKENTKQDSLFRDKVEKWVLPEFRKAGEKL